MWDRIPRSDEPLRWHGLPALPLITKDNIIDNRRAQMRGKKPADLARVVAQMDKTQSHLGDTQSQFLMRFAQNAGLGAFLTLARAAGKIQISRPWNVRLSVPPQDEQERPCKEQQLGSIELVAWITHGAPCPIGL